MKLINLLIIILLIKLCDGNGESKKEAAKRLDSICDKVLKSSLKIFRSMLDQGLDVNLADKEGNSLLFCIITHTKYTKDPLEIPKITSLIKEMIKRGVDLSRTDDFKRTCLHYAAMFGTTEIMKLFLEEGVDVNAQDVSGNTPYHVLQPVKFQRKESLQEKIELIKKYDPDMSIRNNFGQSPEDYLKSQFENEGPSITDMYESQAAKKVAKEFIREKYGQENAELEDVMHRMLRSEL